MNFHSGGGLRVHGLALILLATLVAGSGGRVSAGANDECLACHGDKGATMSRKGKTISLYVDAHAFAGSAHSGLECVNCHEHFKASEIPHAKRIIPVNCLSCHDGDQFTRFAGSVHGAAKNGSPALRCADCHGNHAIAAVTSESPDARKQFAVAVCSRCHAAEQTHFVASDHGLALASGVRGAPTCIDCHDEHDVRKPSDVSAPTNHASVAAMCLRCHLDNPDVRNRVGPSAGFVSSYENSVHARAVQHGDSAAATCTDCHGSHDMRKGSNPQSGVARKNIAATCGRCHAAVLAEYRGSIHGTKFASGVTASAVCTDCHGEHNILSPRDSASPIAARNVSAQVCSPCHASVRLTRKFGLASDRFQTFADSYHGLAGEAGSVEVANCASCHGVHDIKPSSDSTSRISRQNIARTCGTCHPGANENFAKGSVHVIASSGNEQVLYIVATGYIALIAVVVGGMFLHNLLDFLRKSRRKLGERRGAAAHNHTGHRLYLRMSFEERIQHGALLLSFFTLVLTGFALRFPDAWWVAPVRDISPLAFAARGILHRAAAVVLVLAGAYHIYYVTAVPRGKRLLRDLLPVPQDVRDAVGVLKYNLGISPIKPLFGRFSYIEKSEYWALVWGTIVMAVTGVILWFDNTFLGILTKLWWDVARTVHYYEAWLATLAVIVWHFYFIMFNPDVYPINLAFWKGTLTEGEMAEEHPLELEELRRYEREDAPKPERAREPA
ncbi:MAG TPA: cytochrome b/b6 domain-containing protein [Bacteroidota bacterium]|nr:cytochrome b/b6 domain-containing protein [Bacteroidota bacterium]